MFSLLLSHACTGSRPFPASHPTVPVRFRVHRKLGRDKQNSWSQLSTRILYPTTQHTELGKEGGREGRTFRVFSQVICVALFSGGWLNTCLPRGTSGWIPCFALLALAAFAFPVTLSPPQPMSSFTFTLPIHSPIPPGVSQLCGAELSAGDKPQYSYSLNKTFQITGKMYTLICKILKYTKMKAAVRMQLSISRLHLFIRS